MFYASYIMLYIKRMIPVSIKMW